MHSFIFVPLMAGGVLGRALQSPTPVVTPGPSVVDFEIAKRQDPDAISLAQVLLTAVPETLRQIAATNIPAVSSILWEQFLDENRPQWFLELPWDIQVYLIEKFGPATAILPSPTAPVWSEVSSEVSSVPTNTAPSQPVETVPSQPVETSPSPSTDANLSPSGTTTAPVESQTSSASSQLSSMTTSITESSTSTSSPATTSTKSRSSSARTSSTSSSTPAPAPIAESPNDPGLTTAQKIGIGLGVPLGLIAAALLLFGCCTLLRRRQRKKVDGSIPPSSPGFIPRFAFQERPVQEPSQRLLNPTADTSFSDLHNMTWEDEAAEYTSSSGESVPTLHNQQLNTVPLNQQPIMAPALFHTHSSNRARGKRTSYTSLHSVAEVTEPDSEVTESPVLGRGSPPRVSPQRQGRNRYSPPRPLIPPPIPETAQIKRKPVPSMRTSDPAAADIASQSLLRQTMPESNLRRPRLSTSQLQPHDVSPYVSPIEGYNTFSPTNYSTPISYNNKYTAYEEDYGPEYQHQPQRARNDTYIDMEDSLYGGNTSLSRYPAPPSPKSSKTEWPLRNFVGGSSNRRKSQSHSPLWDRVYESP